MAFEEIWGRAPLVYVIKPDDTRRERLLRLLRRSSFLLGCAIPGIGEIAEALSFALRYDGRKRVHDTDPAMGRITAERLVRHLERSGFVVMKVARRRRRRRDYAAARRVRARSLPRSWLVRLDVAASANVETHEVPRAADGVEVRCDGRSGVISGTLEGFIQTPLGFPQIVLATILLMQVVGQPVPALNEPLWGGDFGAGPSRRVAWLKSAERLVLGKGLAPRPAVRPSILGGLRGRSQPDHCCPGED